MQAFPASQTKTSKFKGLRDRSGYARNVGGIPGLLFKSFGFCCLPVGQRQRWSRKGRFIVVSLCRDAVDAHVGL